MKYLNLLVGSVLCLVTVGSVRATVVGCDDESSWFEPVLEARFRSFRPTGGQEIYLGLSDVGRAENRSGTEVPWVSGTHPIAFVYDPGADRLRATATVQGAAFGVDFDGVASRVAEGGSGFGVTDLNALRVTVVNRDASGSPTGTLRLTDLVLSVDGRALAGAAGASVTDWWMSGLDLSRGFELTGNLVLSGSFSWKQEFSKVAMEVGYAGGDGFQPVPEAPTIWAGLPLLLGAAAAWGRRQRR